MMLYFVLVLVVFYVGMVLTIGAADSRSAVIERKEEEAPELPLLTLAELNALEDECGIPRSEAEQWPEVKPAPRILSTRERAQHDKKKRPEPDYQPNRQSTYTAVLRPDPVVNHDPVWIHENVFEIHLSSGKTRYMYECPVCMEAWKADRPEDLWRFRSHGCTVLTSEQHRERSKWRETWIDQAKPLAPEIGLERGKK